MITLLYGKPNRFFPHEPIIKWVFPQICGTPQNTPKMIIFRRKSHACWVISILGNPQMKELSTNWIWVFPKIVGKPPKWMFFFSGKPYFLMDGFGGIFPTIFGNIRMENPRKNPTASRWTTRFSSAGMGVEPSRGEVSGTIRPPRERWEERRFPRKKWTHLVKGKWTKIIFHEIHPTISGDI